MKSICRFQCALHLSALLVSTFFLANTSIAQASFNFELSHEGWGVSNNGKIERTKERYKSGTHSLKWSWKSTGATMTFRDAKTFEKLFPTHRKMQASCLAFWLYNEKAIKKQLTVNALFDGEVVETRHFNLNFTGWRTLCMPYDVKKGFKIDRVEFKAPEGVTSGSLYFDLVNFNLRPKQYPVADNQQPWMGKPQLLDKKDFFYSTKDASLNRPYLPPMPKAVTKTQQNQMAELMGRYFPPVPKGGKGISDGTVAAVNKKIADWKIKEVRGVVTGRPVDYQFFNKPGDMVNINDYMKVLTQVANAYCRSKENSEHQKAMKNAFVLLCKHYLDQGWQEGSQYVWMGGGYTLRHWVPTLIKMRDVLTEAGIADKMGLSLAFHLGTGNLALQENPTGSMDIINNHIKSLIPALLMISDEKLRLHRLQLAKRYFDTILTNNTVIGPDGTSIHHGMHHFAYGSYSMSAFISRDVVRLAGTEWMMNQKARERLKSYVWSNAFAMNKYTLPPNLNGRAGTPIIHNLSHRALSLAYTGTPDGKEKIDRDMAGLYLLLAEKPDPKAVERFTTAGIKPAVQHGHISFNGAASALHRRGNWLAVMTGMIKFWRGLEIYGWTESNNYARYARNGSLMLLTHGDPVNAKDSGFSTEGWDWCRWPGTTSLVLPAQAMFVGYGFRGNPSTFAGGTTLCDDGIWGMDYKGTDVSFKKSAFFFGNRITVITTDIKSSKDYPAITTVYQMKLDQPKKQKTIVDGKSISELAYEEELDCQENTHWLVDSHQNGYFFFKNQSPITVQRHQQMWTYMTSRYLKDKKNNPILDIRKKKFKESPLAANEKYFTPSQGDYDTAGFNHGIKPGGASCSYMLLVDSNPEKMKQFASDMQNQDAAPCQILQQDQHAHIVFDRASNTVGHVLFSANTETSLKTKSPLIANTEPCFVILRQTGQKMDLSISTSDISLKKTISITIKGDWNIHQSTPSWLKVVHSAPNLTTLTIQMDYNTTRTIELGRGIK